MQNEVRLVIARKQIRFLKKSKAPVLMWEALSKTTSHYERRITAVEINEEAIWITFDLDAVHLRLIYKYIKDNL